MNVVGQIGPGLLVLLGVADGRQRRRRTTVGQEDRRAPRVFEDDAEKMNFGAHGHRLANCWSSVSSHSWAIAARAVGPSFTAAAAPRRGGTAV